MRIDVEKYQASVAAPWGKLFYRALWAQLPGVPGDVLDFGSGLGVTADHLAKARAVVAVEPDEGMRRRRVCENGYEQRSGGLEQFAGLKGRFGLALCHNVLEYALDPDAILVAIAACVRPRGYVSVVKHNARGKVLQAAAFESDPRKALALYRGETAYAASMGAEIGAYEDDWLIGRMSALGFEHEKTLGLRSLFALGPNDAKYAPQWQQDMFLLEREVQEDPAFLAIAYFHHLLFKKEEKSSGGG